MDLFFATKNYALSSLDNAFKTYIFSLKNFLDKYAVTYVFC